MKLYSPFRLLATTLLLMAVAPAWLNAQKTAAERTIDSYMERYNEAVQRGADYSEIAALLEAADRAGADQGQYTLYRI